MRRKNYFGLMSLWLMGGLFDESDFKPMFKDRGGASGDAEFHPKRKKLKGWQKELRKKK